MKTQRKITVLIVDDSLSVRLFLKKMLNSADDIEVVATAADPMQAQNEIKQHNPDVITLDVEMPLMDGLTFLEKIMEEAPRPIIMISGVTQKGSANAIRALELGALDVIAKPHARAAEGLENYSSEIKDKIRAAACSSLARTPRKIMQTLAPTTGSTKIVEKTTGIGAVDGPSSIKGIPVGTKALTTDVVLKKSPFPVTDSDTPLIAIGCSTGGPIALKEILVNLPTTLPGIIVVQHMAMGFIKPFAKRLNETCTVTVQEAENDMEIKSGNVYIAPAGVHLAVKRNASKKLACRIIRGEHVNRHCPAVDVMFRSVADNIGNKAVGVILTGMGNDGASGMKELRNAGALTIAQDEESCIVFGMPRVAIESNAVRNILSLKNIPQKLIGLFDNTGTKHC